MRIGVLDVTRLVRVRRKFRPGGRIVITLVFLVFAGMFWLYFLGVSSDLRVLGSDRALRTSTLAMMGALAVPFCVLLRRKTAGAQVLFTAAAAFNALMILLVTLTILSDTPENDGLSDLALVSAMCVMVWAWFSFSRGVWPSVKSLVPLRRWKAHRLRLALSRRLWNGEWRGTDAPPPPGSPAARRPAPKPKLVRGGAALASGLAWSAVSIFALVNTRFTRALYRLDFGEIVHVLRVDPWFYDDTWPDLHPEDFIVFLLAMLGWFCLRSFSRTLDHWQRGKAPVHDVGLSRLMTPSSVLLLRSFSEDNRGVPLSIRTRRTFFFVGYDGGYTFPTLVQERLAPLGPVHLPLGRTLPPPLAGITHALGEQEWRDEVRAAIPLARMIVVVFGTTPELGWEIETIKESGCLEKTVFLLPHDLFPRRARRRWAALCEFVCPADEGPALAKRISPRKVLAVCRRQGTPVVLTGEQAQMPYESAMDLAAILTLAAPEVTEGVVTKYIDPTVPRFAWLSRRGVFRRPRVPARG
jgi:hypothetical protein